MAQWYVKELSKLTHVSVQTLHHYDRIGLLKPSVRLPNGYRLYSEKDLLKLQQIIALKFFGFELSQVKSLLSNDVDMLEHFDVQSQLLEKKARTFLTASDTLKSIVSDCGRDKSIPWETLIKLIEVYRMTQELENTWAGKALTAEELKQYASYQHEIKTKFSESEEKIFEKKWNEVVELVSNNLKKSPTSEFGISVGKQTMDIVNAWYGEKHTRVRTVVWEKGFKGGHMDNISPEAVAWLDKAISAYYKERISSVLGQVQLQPHPLVLKQWNDLMMELFGVDKVQRDEFYQKVFSDAAISNVAKEWLKKAM